MAENEPIRVSGIITTYDRPAFLPEAIESALAQTLPLSELLVVDDCSPRDIAAITAPFGERVRYLRLPHNQGPSAARNAGVAAATGEVVAFLDDDDLWLPNKIARQVAALHAGHEAALCGWRFADGGALQVQAIPEVTLEHLRWGNPFCGTTGLAARRQALLEEPFDEAIRWGEDWELDVRLARRRALAYVAEPLYLRRYGEHEGLTRQTRSEPVEQLLRKADAARKHRAWLGEWGFRNAVARALLRQFSRRPDRFHQLVQALRHAGPTATFATLAVMYRRSGRRS